MIVTQKIHIDLLRPGIEPQIHAAQDDKYSRNIKIHIFAAGVPWIIPEDASVLVRYRKPDGTGGLYDTLPDGNKASSMERNELTIVLAPQVLTVAGPVSLTVTMIEGKQQLTTFLLWLQVHPDAFADAEDSTEYINVTGFLPAPKSAKPGQYLRVVAVDGNGKVTEVESVDAPGGGNVEITTPDSSQNVSGMSQTLRVALYNLMMDAAYLSSGHEADKAALEELLTGNSGGGESGGDDSGDSGETVVYYTIEKTLTNVSISNGTATVVAGSAYSATLSADEGCTLGEVSVTMGGVAVPVTNGVINIASVTGNIVIVATAEAEAVGGYEWESGVPYDLTDKVTEGIELVTGYGRENAKDTYVSTDYLNCFDADAIYHSDAIARVFFYDANKNYISDAYKNAHPSAKLVPDGAVYVRLTCPKTYWTNAKVVPIAKTTETYTSGVQDVAWETGRLDVNTGAEITATSGSRTDYICINGAKCLHIEGVNSMGVVCLYDANKTFICGVTSQTDPIDLIAQYPGFSYIRVYMGTSKDIILDDSTVYTVSRPFTNVSAANVANACSGETYTNTITAKSGFTLDGGTVSVTMGGVDITETAYNATDGTVTIENVTGNIVITATAVAVTE